MDADDGRMPPREWQLRAIAVPAALVLAVAFHAWDLGHFLQRTFLTMMVHELGHAVTAWWSGLPALPTLWKTLIPETRGTLFPLALAAGNAAVFVWGWRSQRTWLAALGLALGVLQFVATVSRSTDEAQELITFGGDAGAMILGTALILTFFAPPASRLRTNGLRWGFLVIGAAALVDTLSTWWSARGDFDRIPFGEIEGVGLSDPSKLSEYYRWTDRQIVERYVTVGQLCLVVIAVAWAWSVWSARRAALARA